MEESSRIVNKLIDKYHKSVINIPHTFQEFLTKKRKSEFITQNPKTKDNMTYKKPRKEILNNQSDVTKMAIDKKVEENYVEFIPTDQHQMEGLTSLITIKTGDKITEIVVKNEDPQEIKKDLIYQTINKVFPTKLIRKNKNNNSTKHQFSKLEITNRNNIKKYATNISKNTNKN
jgi:hypothetical protein